MHTDSTPASAAFGSADSLGQRLRATRTAQGLSIEEAASRLKLPMAIVEAMEADDLAVLGAPVYARGRLGNYVRLLGLPASLVDVRFASGTVPPPPLVSAARDTRFERGLQRVARQGIYVVLTATIVLPVVWLATHHQLPHSNAALTTLDAPPVAAKVARKQAPMAPTEQTPVAASMAPFASYRAAGETSTAAQNTASATLSNPVTAPTGNGLQLRFSGGSWVELIGTDGHVVERGMIEAGSVRDYRTGAIAHVVIGNASSVRVLQDGQAIDLFAFSHANLARFTLSSDGKIAPSGD
jgi:cytoskeleton protein RodZ